MYHTSSDAVQFYVKSLSKFNIRAGCVKIVHSSVKFRSQFFFYHQGNSLFNFCLIVYNINSIQFNSIIC